MRYILIYLNSKGFTFFAVGFVFYRSKTPIKINVSERFNQSILLFPPINETEIGQEATNFAIGVVADIGCISSIP